MGSKNHEPDEVITKWYGKLLLAIAMFGGAVYFYEWLSMCERDGGSVHWLVAVVYKVGGKFTASALPVSPGVILAYMGIRQLVEERTVKKPPSGKSDG